MPKNFLDLGIDSPPINLSNYKYGTKQLLYFTHKKDINTSPVVKNTTFLRISL